jgi:hypothetical protein
VLREIIGGALTTRLIVGDVVGTASPQGIFIDPRLFIALSLKPPKVAENAEYRDRRKGRLDQEDYNGRLIGARSVSGICKLLK